MGGKYVLGQKLGSGAFGVVYQATDASTSKQVAVKLETVKSMAPQLSNEASVMKRLSGRLGFPQFIWYGTEGEYNILVTELLGQSLETYKEKHGVLSIQSSIQIGLQMLNRLQSMQDRCYIHRDLKPDNMLVGKTYPRLIYLIDFGLSRLFTDPKTRQHIPFKESKSLIGTARYASASNHAGLEQGRRDDLESLAYILIYILKGRLPWQGIKEKNKYARYGMIGEYKRTEPIRSLCKGLPDEIGDLLEYSRSLRFDEAPNFTFLISIFAELAQRLKIKVGLFDWNTPIRKNRIRASTTLNTSSSPTRKRSLRRSKSKIRSSTLNPERIQRSDSVETTRAVKPFIKDRKALMDKLSTLAPPGCAIDLPYRSVNSEFST